MKKNFTIGSLFDGSGGFPLAAFMCGGVPVWASEVEPYPIAVTKSRFPFVKHLGDISKINGAEIEPVDVITFGSPCQDLSVAGKRAGLKHEANGDEETTRSGLFMEAVRIIKEMREATNGLYPRIALWENVPGAFSSNKGEDFRIVCEELIKIVEPRASMPAVPKNGWAYADSYVGDGWSLAYRVFDAQYWGVPQRRRRIHLVADFRGECAREILFEREGLRGYFAEGRTPWQSTPPDAEGSSGADNRAGKSYGIVSKGNGEAWAIEEKHMALSCGGGQAGQGFPCVMEAAGFKELNSAKARSDGYEYEIAPCLAANKHDACAVYAIDQQGGKGGANYAENVMPTPCSDSHGTPHAVAYTLKIRSGCAVDANGKAAGKGALIQKDKTATLAVSQDQYLFQPVSYDARDNGDGETVSTITGDHENRITDYTSVVVEPIPIHDQATRFSGKRGNKADGKGNGLGVGVSGDPMNTLTSGDRHAVAYAEEYPAYSMKSIARNGVALTEQANPICASDYKDPDIVAQPIANDRAFFNQGQNALYEPQYYTDGTVPTLVAKGPSAVAVRYIVRRLTPTECARLQGFADRWGDIDSKEDFTDEEYAFWLNVRNTHAEINGKAVKDYTKQQMLTWYNKLQTDSAEYKMWGNGIALPPALYCMQGIADVMGREKKNG